MRRVVLVLLCWLCCGQLFAQQRNQQYIEKLNYAYTYLRNNYVDEVDLEPLVEAAIDATLKELDPHSSYLTREEFMGMYEGINGEFSGIGVNIISLRDTVVVTSVLSNSPSERAGLLKNDRILSVNGTPLTGIDRVASVELLRGKKGSIATLSILRNGAPLTIDVKRDDIPTKAISAAFMLEDGVAYVCVDSFLSRTTTEEFIEAVESLNGVKAMVLDLRGNIGGLLTSAVQFSELFLGRGDVIVEIESRKNSSTYEASRRGIYANLPLVVLIDEATASSSEIVAGAFQDHDRAVLVGRRSFGKGLVQKLIKFRDESGMRITTARYRTPSGRIIQRPYSNGEREEYFTDRERYSPLDTATIPDSLVYTTLKSGRKVYGGGGITPDCYIVPEITDVDRYVADVVQSGIVVESMVEFFDRVPVSEFMKCYPTIEAFISDFEFDDEADRILNAKIDALALEYSADVATVARAQIKDILRATIADDLYRNGAYINIYGRCYDQTLNEAVDILGDKARFGALLGEK